MERAILQDYESDIATIVQNLTRAKAQVALEILEVPEHIRGYGPVKERHVKAAQQKRGGLLQQFNSIAQEDQAA